MTVVSPRGVLGWLAPAAVVLLLTGCATHPESIAPPNLELICSGEGSPTVILSPGLRGEATVFESLQHQVETDTRVCSYSRAGLGSSPPWPEGEDDPSAAASADQLRATLEENDISGPYVVVGWSYGGMVAEAFTERHGDVTAGLVLLDTPAVSMFDRRDFNKEGFEEGGRAIGVDLTRAQLADLDFGDRPTVVITRGKDDGFDEATMKWWVESHDDFAAASTDSLRLIAFDAGHGIHWDSEALVEKAIDTVVESVRTGEPMPDCADEEWAVYSGECRSD